MATFYISPTGNDSTGTGAQGNPWLTISKAFSSSVANDTINCLPGTYTWVGQNFTSNRTVTGFGALGSVIFDGAAAALTWLVNGSLCTFNNLTFQNATGNTGDMMFGSTSGANVTMTYTNCFFNAISTPATTNNFGIWGTNSGNPTETLNFTACLFYNLTTTGGLAQAPAYFKDRGNALVVSLVNCTIYTNIADPVTLPIYNATAQSGSDSLAVTNCIIWNANGTGKEFFRSGTAPTTITGSNNDILGFTGAPSLTNQLSTDPLFVDAASLNFNLRPTSPCIGAGTMI